MSRRPEANADDGLRAVDRAFADTLRRLDPATDARVLHAAAQAQLAVSSGHAAFDPAQDDDGEPLRAALASSSWVATPAADAIADPARPLVLEHGLLYLRRYREYERRLAVGLRRLATQAPTDTATRASTIAALAPLFARLFPDARRGDAQARAAALALLRALLLVTGGPGTGKTTTIARVLLLLVEQARVAGIAPPRIALAAPTGRAADRMAGSLHAAIAQLRNIDGIDASLLDALPTTARTLHRLLGTIPDRPHFRHDATQPLAYDVVVVDEASMVDLPMMCKLVEAIADGARLLLLGDPDQLPSVEAGDVLAAVVAAAGAGDTLDEAAATTLAPLLGPARPDHAPSGDLFTTPRANTPLSGNRVHLQHGWRQSGQLDLAPLAEAVRTGDADQALALLQAQSLAGVHYHPAPADPLAGDLRETLLAPWRALADADDPAQALALADRTRLLTALRHGPQGADTLNARIEDALAGVQREPYFHGRLLLVTENSYRHGLFNGDIGVCLRDSGGGSVAWFAGSTDVRGFHPAALPAHAGAFALTVHKAQGSEFDQAWLLLPRQDARVLSRELLYTAITRARDAVHVCADASVLCAALARHAARVSGLTVRLQDEPFSATSAR